MPRGKADKSNLEVYVDIASEFGRLAKKLEEKYPEQKQLVSDMLAGVRGEMKKRITRSLDEDTTPTPTK